MAERPLPSKEELRRFIEAAPGKVGKSEISRHFGLSSDQRPALRALLKDMLAEGGAMPAGRRGLAAPGRLPEMAVVEVFGTDPDGDPLARPLGWKAEQGEMPLIYMRPERAGQPALAPGERVLARLKPAGRGRYDGSTVKRIGSAPARLLGLFEDGRIKPVDRRHRAEWEVPTGEAGGAEHGELVLAEPLPGRPMGLRPARIIERLGRMGEPRSVSLLCIHVHGIPHAMPDAALAEAAAARAVTPEGREDLRAIPLVTIDGEDARDFDDAVWAGPVADGWRLLVAIADVAHYVRPGGALDREAWLRGNSVYFPDRVVPMLPEALSNGWCSLKPGEERGCLFAEITIDTAGSKTGHRFGRGIMRSAARLTYEGFEAGEDPAGTREALLGAHAALQSARDRRGTLDLDLPERRVRLDEAGRVLAVEPRARLLSHRLVEEFMIAANVAAAEELERLGQPCLYRVHDRPADEKLEGLRSFLASFDIALPPGDRVRPADFARVLERVRGTAEERLVNETLLRGQSQAAYAPDNIGHFGLALPRYAHFTSPIRRYADLLVHRALVRGLRLGADGLTEAEAARLPETGEHVTATERRAAAAERDAVERYLAAYMAHRIGDVFPAHISGVTRFGLFVTLEASGAAGIVPLASLPDDRWLQDLPRHALVGQRTGLRFALGQAVEVRLAEAVPRTGGLVFHLMQGIPPARPRGARRR